MPRGSERHSLGNSKARVIGKSALLLLSQDRAAPTKEDDNGTAVQTFERKDGVQGRADSIPFEPVTYLQKLVLRGTKDAIVEVDALLAEGCGHNEAIA